MALITEGSYRVYFGTQANFYTQAHILLPRTNADCFHT